MNLATDGFEAWLGRWRLEPDGEPFVTEYTKSRLLAVRQDGRAAMLKLAADPDEVRGGEVMEWWDGHGAARVLAREGAALLLERARSRDGLSDLSRRGSDPEATALLCRTVAELHRPRSSPPPAVPRLSSWFGDLATVAAGDERLARANGIAKHLLATEEDVVLLHGDIHHENVLDFCERGWLALDPKGLLGERAYDYANIFRNPDRETALVAGRLEARLKQVSAFAQLNPDRLLGWVVAHAGLSAAWSIIDRRDATWSLAILHAALGFLDGLGAGAPNRLGVVSGPCRCRWRQ